MSIESYETDEMDDIVERFIDSDMSVDDFIENIESTDIAVTPQKSPYPSEKKEEDDDDEEDSQ